MVSAQEQGMEALVVVEFQNKPEPLTVNHIQTTASESLLWAWNKVSYLKWITPHEKWERGINNLYSHRNIF